MQATAAYMACCQKSSACHQATSSSRPRLGPRRGQPPQPGPRTAAWSSACRGNRTRAGTARAVPLGQRPGLAGPAPLKRVGGQAEEHLAGERAVSRVQGRQLAQHLENAGITGEAVEQGATCSRRVLGSWPLPVGHVTTVDQNHQLRASRGRPSLPAAGHRGDAMRRNRLLVTLGGHPPVHATRGNRRSDGSLIQALLLTERSRKDDLFCRSGAAFVWSSAAHRALGFRLAPD
jgi:hypothetical protein